MIEDDFINQMLSSKTPESAEAVLSFTKLLMQHPLTEKNSNIYLKILKLNNTKAADIIFQRREPSSFFSVLHPGKELISFVIDILVMYKPKELYYKIVLCCLGVLLNAYKKSVAGFKLYNLSISDLNHIGKYFNKKHDDITENILKLLESIWQTSENKNKDTATHAQQILDTYNDNNKKLEDIIPHNLF